MSVARRHWLLLVTVVSLGVAAYAAFFSGAAEASGFYWDGWWNWNGQWCQGLFNSAHELLYYHCS